MASFPRTVTFSVRILMGTDEQKLSEVPLWKVKLLGFCARRLGVPITVDVSEVKE